MRFDRITADSKADGGVRYSAASVCRLPPSIGMVAELVCEEILAYRTSSRGYLPESFHFCRRSRCAKHGVPLTALNSSSITRYDPNHLLGASALW